MHRQLRICGSRCRRTPLRAEVPAALLLWLLAASGPAPGTPPPPGGAPTVTAPTTPGEEQTPPAPAGRRSGLLRQSYLLGDLGGLREKLSKYGISLYLAETSEVLGNVTGGVRRGAKYDGVTVADVQLDTQRAFAHHGGTFNASLLQIHGSNLSAENLYTLQTASGIEADRATRLWELWYQQKFLEEDRLDVKVGQQSLDQEFMVSLNGLVFVNTMFGWPMAPSADLPGGGPAYPLSALGVRVRTRPTDAITVLAGVFNGSPVSNNNGDPQRENANGLRFPLNGGALVIAEVQYLYPALGTMVYADRPAPKPGLYKLGAYYDTEDFADEEFGTDGLSLANPASSGVPRTHHGNYGLYGVVDQLVWLSPDDPDRTLSFFARAVGQPQSDRNLISLGVNVGFVLRDPLHLRDEDTFGVGLGYARVTDGASALDRDTNYFSGNSAPIRSSETFIEATYQYQYAPWCQIQPDIQYVFNPGGDIASPNASGQRIGDELVIGTRVNILF